MPRLLRWPYPYRWAFAVTDDTDETTLEVARVFYERCLSRGVLPTKTVWTHRAVRTCGSRSRSAPDPGATLEDPDYLRYCLELQRRGVEMALHGASAGDNRRADVERSFERFREVFGHDPAVYVHHARNRENLYWGPAQFQLAPLRVLARLALRGDGFEGHVQDSEYFWGDIAWERVRYIRLFRTHALDALSRNPSMPYHRADTPLVRMWFSASGQGLSAFRRLTPAAMDRLAARDGAVVVYCHARFLMTGPLARPTLHASVGAAIDRIGARSDVWRVGASALLDRCFAMKNMRLDALRNAVVLSNASGLDVADVQIEAHRTLYGPDGSAHSPDAAGIIRVPVVPAHGCVPLYHSRHLAEVGDPAGAPPLEDVRMSVAEVQRLFHQLYAIHLPEALRRLRTGGSRADDGRSS